MQVQAGTQGLSEKHAEKYKYTQIEFILGIKEKWVIRFFDPV